MNDNPSADMSTPGTLASAALGYVRDGHAIFPLWPNGTRRNGKPIDKAPRIKRGLLEATTDVETVRQHWNTNPHDNIGLWPAEGECVIDVEGPDGGHEVNGLPIFAELVEKLGGLDGYPVAETPSGGIHIWGSHDLTSDEIAAKPTPGIDVKTHSGYVVAPPSMVTGKSYRWRVPLNGKPPRFPTAWQEWMRKPEPALTPERHNIVQPRGDYRGDSIADAYCAETSWAEVLEPHGWTQVNAATTDPDADGARWRHPTATAEWSATIKYGLLFVYSTNTPFDVTAASDPHGCGRFCAYATLNHGGDESAAALALIRARKGGNMTRTKETAGQKSKAENNGQASEFDADDTPVYADRLLTRSDLLTLPDPQPLIENVLDQGTAALLYGKWGTAKTFIALDWGLSVATGHNWQERKTVQRRVLYVVGEGAFGFKGLVAAWEIGWRTKISDDGLSILPVPVNLMNSVEVGNLMALIDWGGYSFIILDTLARCMVGADENSAKDCGVVVDVMTRLLERTPNGRGVVLGAHHAGKDGKTLRGSSAFESGVDTVYFTSRDEGIITLNREKRKDGPENDCHLLKLEPIEGTGSCVIGVSHGVSHGGDGGSAMATLRLVMSQHFRLTGATTTQLRQLCVDDGTMSRATFYRALTDLDESGWLYNTGPDKRPFWVISDDE